MVYIKDRVVVEGGRGWFRVGCEIEIMLTGILPPWRCGLGMEVSSVPVVVKSQTETCSSQSKWPDLGVLSMAPDWGG